MKNVTLVRRRSVFSRWLVTLVLQSVALQFITGCGASYEAKAPTPGVMSGDSAGAPAPPPQPPSDPQPPPPPSPANVSAGYAPPAAPPARGARDSVQAESMDMPAMFSPQAPQAAPPPPPSPSPGGPAGRSGGAGRIAQAPPQPKPVRQAPPPPPPKPALVTPPRPPPAVAAKGVDKAPKQVEPSGPPTAPLLIYVGDVQMQVDEGTIPATIDRVIDIAESLGGYLAGRKDTSVQVRIPSQHFRDGFTRIENIGDVLHRSVSADDVSEQYSDLEVRLANLRVTQRRLQEFLARTVNIPEMLTVGKELDRVAGEIEQIQGKMRFLRSRAAFSLITVALQNKPKAIAKVVEVKPAPPPPRDVDLPIDWLPRLGLDSLLNLRSK